MRKIELLLLMMVVSLPLFSQNFDTIFTFKDITWNSGSKLRHEKVVCSNCFWFGDEEDTWYNPLPPNENYYDWNNQEYWISHDINFFPNSVNNEWKVRYLPLYNENHCNRSYCTPGTNSCLRGNEIIWGLVVVLSINNDTVPFAYFFHSSESGRRQYIYSDEDTMTYDNLEYCQLCENGFSNWSKITSKGRELTISSSSTMTSITYAGKTLSYIPTHSDGVYNVFMIALPQARIVVPPHCSLWWTERKTKSGDSPSAKPKLQKKPPLTK